MADNFLKTNTTLVDKASGAVVGKDGFKIASGITPPGFLTFADGTEISTAPVSRQVVIDTATFAAGQTAAQVLGIGIYNPPAFVFTAPYFSGPKDIVVELTADFGNTGTTITAGETCVLRVLIEFNLADGTNINLPSQYVPASASLCNPAPAGLGLQTLTASFPYSLSTGQQLSGITLQYDLVGPASGSTNVIQIGSSSVKIYGAG